MSTFPDYYALLNCSKTATQDEIRQAYKRESLRLSFLSLLHVKRNASSPQFLRTHPDRIVNGSPTELKNATERFQEVADAYYVLSDTARRREYDLLFASRSTSYTSPSFFSEMFSGTGSGTGTPRAEDAHADAEGVFADVFDEVCSLSSDSSCFNSDCTASSFGQRWSAVRHGGLGLVPSVVQESGLS
jgi:curved DNA-binding protein CbpA